MSSAEGRAGHSAAATRTFGQLRIDKRVLSTPTRTIAIANIANISVGTHVERQPRLMWFILMLASCAVAYGSSFGPQFAGPFHPSAVGVVAGLVAAGFLFLALKPDDKTHYLLISSNDAVLSRFAGPDRAILEDVRQILSAKINQADEQAIFNINFEKGVIENLSIGQAGTVNTGTDISGSGNTVASRLGTAVGTARAAVDNANGGNGRVGTSDTGWSAQRSPGAQLGKGHVQNGAAHGYNEAIDFARLLPIVVEMHRFYQRQPGAEHLDKRLEELELLMRSGAQLPAQKSRIRDLAGELSHILQAYPQVVQVFADIRGLTGM